MDERPLLGIDFGTSYSTMCWWNPRTSAPEVIRNEHGEEKTPSVVYRSRDGSVLVGQPAADQLGEIAHLPPDEQAELLARTFRSVKRHLKEDLPQALPDGTTVTPVELAADILEHLRRCAEAGCFGGTRVRDVVLTHPVSFSKREKESLVEAAALAGFHEVTLVEEPVAAVLGYIASGAPCGSSILVFDLGGGTLDLALVERDPDGGYRLPVPPIGDTCAGDDLDRLIYDHFEQRLKQEHGAVFSSAGLNLAVLAECRKCKEKLTTVARARISHFLPELKRPVGFDLSRQDLEKLILDLAVRAAGQASVMLERAKKAGRKIDTVLLVGGSSRIPLIRARLAEVLSVKPQETMHTDVAVALGAAFVACDARKAAAKYGGIPVPKASRSFAEAIAAGDLRGVRMHANCADQIDGFVTYRGEEMPALHWAAVHGRLDVCRLLLASGARVDTYDCSGRTSLDLACEANQERIVGLLLDSGAQIDFTTLFNAVMHKSHAAVRVLLAAWGEHGSDERSALIHAILCGQSGEPLKLIDHLSDLDLPDGHGMALLHWAALAGNVEAVRELLMNGADILRPCSSEGSTVLHLAGLNGDANTLRLLIEKGADLMSRDWHGMTPLHIAARGNRTEAVDELLKHGAEFGAKDGLGDTAISIAARRGHTNVVTTLLDSGEETTWKWARVALWEAAKYGHEHLTFMLLELLDAMLGEMPENYTPRNGDHTCLTLQYAAENGHETLVQALLDRCPYNTETYRNYSTALSGAARNGHEKIVQILLDQGPIERARDFLGVALGDAARNGHESLVLSLLERDTDINGTGRTNYNAALENAAEGGHESIVHIFLDRGADIKGGKGDEALYRAADKGHDGIVRVLLDQGGELAGPKHAFALHRAIENCQEAVVLTLLERGTDINAQNRNGYTPLDRAVNKGYERIVRILLDRGAEVSRSQHASPLCGAIEEGRDAVVRTLLEYGADVEMLHWGRWTSLQLAVMRDRASIVRILLNHGASIPAKSDEHTNSTVLHWAARMGHSDILATVLDRGEDVDKLDGMNRNALHHAASAGHAEVVATLLDRGASPNMPDYHGKTPLHHAASTGHADIVAILLESGANPNTPDLDGKTPLHHAASSESVLAVSVLINAGVDINARDASGQDALYIALQSGRYALAQLLISQGADIGSWEQDKKDDGLYRATLNDYPDMVIEFLNRGADIHCPFSCKWDNALHVAAEKGNATVVQILLDRGAKVEDYASNQGTPLHIASSNGHDSVVRILLDRGANIEAQFEDQRTALQLAATNGYDAVVRTLLDHGADIAAREVDQQTPLHFAAQHGHDAVVRTLLDHGANIEAKDRWGWTPLHRSASNGHDVIVRTLLDHCADVAAREVDQQTPLHFAAQNGHAVTVCMLLDRGAEIDARDNAECSPLHRAAQSGNLDIVKILLAREADASSVDSTGLTARAMAASGGHSKVVAILADACSKDGDEAGPDEAWSGE